MKNKERLTFGVLVGGPHNLGLQVIFVGKNVTVPFGHLLVLANPDVLRHLKCETIQNYFLTLKLSVPGQ